MNNASQPASAAQPDIDSQALRRLHAYWLAQAGGRCFPSRADIDPLHLGFILGDLILIDVEADGPQRLRYRYRLYGSNVVQRQGFDLTGTYLDQHPWPAFVAEITPCYNRVVQNGTAEIFSRQQELDGRSFRHQSLLLPLGLADRVNMLLIGVDFRPDPLL